MKTSILPFALVAALPYIWYVAIANHSWVHYWFTYRNQLVFVMAVLFMFWIWWERPKRG